MPAGTALRPRRHDGRRPQPSDPRPLHTAEGDANRTMTATTGTTRDPLRQEQIVQAAVVLLDEGGIENLTMRRVGSRLGITGAALYWHIKSRHELLLLAVDSVWGQAPLCLDDLPWRAAVLAMADNLRSMCVRHPWLLTAMTVRPLDGPARHRHDQHLLAVCQTAGLTRQDAEQTAQSIIAFAIGSALADTPSPYVSFGLQVDSRRRRSRARRPCLTQHGSPPSAPLQDSGRPSGLNRSPMKTSTGCC